MVQPMTAQEQTEQPEPPKRGKRRGFFRGLGAGSFLLTVLIILVCGCGFYLGSGRPITAPDWLHERIEARANSQMENVHLNFGGIQLVVVEGWQPQLLSLIHI